MCEYPFNNINRQTEARWHIGMSTDSHQEDLGSIPGMGQFFRIKMKYFHPLYSRYPHQPWLT